MNDEYRIEVDTGSGGYGLQIRQQNFLQMSNLNMEKKKQKRCLYGLNPRKKAMNM